MPGVEKPLLSKAEGFIMPNHDTGRILPAESQRNTINPQVAVTDSSETDYDLGDESSVYSTPLLPLKKLDGAKPVSRPKTIKSILKSRSTFKDEALKSVIINEPSSAPAKGNKGTSASKVNSAPADYVEVMIMIQMVITESSLLKEKSNQETFNIGEALQAKNVDALKSEKTGSSKANRFKTPTRGWVSRQN
ncbi:hypothetical protein Tco_0619881 [Tanacetum coccineum]